MDEQMEGPTEPTGLSRRDLMKRGAFVVGAAAVWSTPMVQTLGMRAAAASTPADFCPGTNDPPPVWMVLRYLPNVCSGSAVAIEQCSGAAPSGPVDIKIIKTGGPDQGTWWVCNVAEGDRFYFEGSGPSTKLNPNVKFELYTPGTTTNPLQTIQFHTSCSQPLNIGDRFASLVLTGASDDANQVGDTQAQASKSASTTPC